MPCRYSRVWAFGFTGLLLVSCSKQEANANSPRLGPTAPVPVKGPNPLAPDASRPLNPTCIAPARPRAEVELEAVFDNLELSAPVGMVQAKRSDGEASGRFFVIEQAGAVRSFRASDSGRATDVVVSDLSGRAIPGPNLDERGLLGIALHPRFPEDPRVFLAFTTNSAGMALQLSSFVANDGSIDVGSEVSLVTIEQPYSNHNGGGVVFGPDGYLYLGVGDGGDGGDPHGHGQNTNTLLGSMLRIDVDASSASGSYGIPADNPFVSGGGAPEIYAYGLRNPWRFSFDPDNGRLWVGDVGQNEWEEVTIVENGGNYGWNVWEGDVCFAAATCSSDGFSGPVHVYANPPGSESRSVTGGYVYRGSELVDLVGSYVYGDFATGEMWRLVPDGDGYENRVLLSSGFNISSFAEDDEHELYAIDYGGRIMRFVTGVSDASQSTLVPLLSLTGCVNPEDPTEVTSAAIPYDVALPFWSDGATKERYLALPDGTQMTVHADGDIELPPSAVTMKHFRHEGALIETRFYVRHSDGEYSGFSYAWREDGSDAELVTEPMTRTFGDFVWTYPGRNQCNQCHTAVAGRSLGLELAQLDIENSEVSVNQLEALRRLGMLSGAASADVVFDGEASLAQRARAYLHVNCGNCHQPGGPGRGGLDLRFDVPLGNTGLCEPASLGDLGIAGGLLVAPGSPESSVLIARVDTRGENAMPPLASRVVDTEGVSLLNEFVRSLASCP